MRDLTQAAEKIYQLNIFFSQSSNVLTAYIFGSFGTDVQSPLSDLDLAVLYDSGPPLLDEPGFAAEISSILGRDDVDVVNLNTAPVYIQHQVIYTGTKIYEKEA